MVIKKQSLSNLSSLFNQTKANSEHKVGDLVKLSIAEVVSNPQVRKHFKGIESLADSIKEFGLQQPINVSPRNSEGKYVILQGERRWRACKLLGLTQIDCVIRENPKDEINRILSQLTENIQRDEMDPVDLAMAFKSLVDYGLKATDIATALGKNRSYVSVYLALTDMPAELDQLRQEHDIRDPWILKPLCAMFKADPAKSQELVQSVYNRGNDLNRTMVSTLKDLVIPRQETEKKVEKVEPVKPQVEGKQAAEQEKQDDFAWPLDNKSLDDDNEQGSFKFDHKDEQPEQAKPVKKEAYLNIPNGVEKVQAVRIFVLVMVPGFEEPQVGYIAPDLVTDEPDSMCIVVDDKVYVLPTKDMALSHAEVI